jgi:pilus assembly protein FimV
MRRASLSVSLVIAGSALLCASGSVQALGFGRSINASYLGQPLNFAATVRLEGEEALPRECVTAEVLSGDFRVAPTALRISVEPGTNPNERQVRISTTTAIDEPVVTVTLTVGCQARLTRSFVTLVDPPGVNLAGTAAAEVTLPPQRLESDVAPVVAVSQGAAAASAPGGSDAAAPAVERPVRPRAVAAATVPTARPAGAAAARPRERKRAVPPVANARSGGARLQLEAGSAAVVAAAASAVASTQAAAAQAVAAAASEVVASNMAAASAAASASAAQERIVSLEEQLRLLREESKKTQQALATLQASLNDAQSSRYANPLVYGLAWLSALLALAVAALWWRQSQMRTSSQWWLAPTGGNAGATASVKPVAARGPVAEAAMARQETQPAVMDDRSIARGAAVDDEPMPTAAPPLDAPVSVLPPAAEPVLPRRELSVEELIDLEQQADFFVVLGQDDAAIDLLMGHVRSSGGASPLPYLKLLEIYRRRGDRDAYERVRERFNRRFSAYAPDWDNDLAQGRALDDYPPVLRQLQRLWDEPMRVTHMLDAALMRQDADGETFDLPAYRELLFLYSIARDLAEHPTNARAVDLLLPMDGEASEKPIEELTASRLMGFAPTNQLTVQVDLDVTRPMPEPGSSDFMGLVDPKLKRGDGDRY